MRRVICGPKADGISSILVDGPPHHTAIGDNGVPLPLPEGNDQHLIWAAQSLRLDTTRMDLDVYDLNLAPGNVRFLYITIPPNSRTPLHRTPRTVDYTTVVTGHITLEAEDGSSVELRPGDTAVQLSGMHLWVNNASERCVMTTLAVGIEPQNQAASWFEVPER